LGYYGFSEGTATILNTGETMTPEERLNQVEALLETAARYIDRHSRSIADNTDEIMDIRRSMLSIQSQVLEMQSEIRGLQIENRRIIERVFRDE